LLNISISLIFALVRKADQSIIELPHGLSL
jgi:hypothetical protein